MKYFGEVSFFDGDPVFILLKVRVLFEGTGKISCWFKNLSTLSYMLPNCPWKFLFSLRTIIEKKVCLYLSRLSKWLELFECLQWHMMVSQPRYATELPKVGQQTGKSFNPLI